MAKRKLAEGCKCLGQVQEQLKEDNCEVVTGFIFRTNGSKSTVTESPPYLMLSKLEKTRSRKKMPVIICSYCPFCGQKYPD